MREGERGGRYVLMQGKKHYLSSSNPASTRKHGGLGDTQEHTIQVFENVEDEENQKLYYKSKKLPYLYYHEKRANEDAKVQQLLSLMFPDETNMTTCVREVLDELYRVAEYAYTGIIAKRENVPSDTKLVVIGDVHGEVDPIKNTLAHWYDQGFINENGRLHENVMVISTGDMVDYSTNSFDILYAMLKLRSLNPDQVILLRGNHEGEWWVSGKQTLYDELSMKEILPILQDEFQYRKRPFVPQTARWILEQNMKRLYYPVFRGMYPDKPDEDLLVIMDGWMKERPYVHEFLCFTALLRNVGRTMLLLQYKDDSERFAFMHGMWPVVNYGHDDTVDLEFWKEGDDEISTPMKHDDSCRPNFHMATMWNDLSDGPITRKSRRGIPYCVEVGSNDLLRIMHENHVKAIFRGHQDLCHTQQGMMTYDATGMYTCGNGVAASLSKECKNGEEPKGGWCESPVISIKGTPVDNDDAARRVFTSSMAHWKSKGYACMGAYSVISIAPVGTSVSGGSQYTKRNHKKNKGGDTFPKIPTPVIRGEQTPWPNDQCQRQEKSKNQS